MGEAQLFLKDCAHGLKRVGVASDDRSVKARLGGSDVFFGKGDSRSGPLMPPLPPQSSVKLEQNASLKQTLKVEMRAHAPGKSPQALQEFTDKFSDRSEAHRKAMNQALRDVCRNCFLVGKGFVNHGLRKCREEGNQCLVKCSIYIGAGCTAANIIHWAEDYSHSH